MSSTELTFHSFPKLPAEIRIQIWKLAVQDAPGREVRLRNDTRKLLVTMWDTRITSATAIPPLLHTCHLSRMLAKERWALDFTIFEGDEKMVYVDVKTDRIRFPDERLLALWKTGSDPDEIARFVEADNLWVETNTYRDLEGHVEHLMHVDFRIHRYLPPWF